MIEYPFKKLTAADGGLRVHFLFAKRAVMVGIESIEAALHEFLIKRLRTVTHLHHAHFFKGNLPVTIDIHLSKTVDGRRLGMRSCVPESGAVHTTAATTTPEPEGGRALIIRFQTNFKNASDVTETESYFRTSTTHLQFFLDKYLHSIHDHRYYRFDFLRQGARP
jgi:hypothetical protein